MMPLTMIAEAVHEAAEMIEADGNSGIYADRFPDSCYWITRPQYKQHRDGILFYSSGHGWRVRRRPTWQEIFKQRFPFYGREAKHGDQKG